MALKLKWAGTEDLDRVIETRWMCYGHARKDLPRFAERLHSDPRGKPGDYLLAERDGVAVGTATSLTLRMWMRGAAFDTQSVAWVGTVKSARRRGGTEPGVASAVMNEIVRMGRERENVLSALMPFRVSFYEHFGYGLVERRSEWTIPMATIVHRDCPGWRLAKGNDYAAMGEEWQKSVEAGQCDIERSAARWAQVRTMEEDGMVFVDRPDAGGPVAASVFVTQEMVNGRNLLKVQDWSASGTEAFVRLLAFLGTMRDQFSTVSITTPATFPVNRLLREAQIPHRIVDHPVPEYRPYTRMQLRILDHQRFLEAIRWPEQVRGRATVAIHESEGHVSRIAIEVEAGGAKVTEASGEMDFECADRQWASIAAGDISASAAARWGLAKENRAAAMGVLDSLAAGPAPFCREFF